MSRRSKTKVSAHIQKTCNAAGLEVMVQIYDIVMDREQIPAEQMLRLTSEDVTDNYWDWVGPAIDGVEGDMLDDDRHLS